MSEFEVHGVKRYGTTEEPLPIDQARAIISEDFRKFSDLITAQVVMPEGHSFGKSPAFNIEHKLKWFSGCEVASSRAGLSVTGGRSSTDEADEFAVRVEVRYFHPELHFRESRSNKARTSHEYSEGFSAQLWVEQGRPFVGMRKSLITGDVCCRDMASVEALASEVVERVNQAIARRSMPKREELDCSVG